VPAIPKTIRPTVPRIGNSRLAGHGARRSGRRCGCAGRPDLLEVSLPLCIVHHVSDDRDQVQQAEHDSDAGLG
jgi:hypothetical protein